MGSMMNAMLTISLLGSIALSVQAPALKLTFAPESDSFVEATRWYQEIWDAEGRKMLETLELVTGLKFREKEIKVIVFEGASNSGFGDRPMRLRASYPEDVKKATLVHELGHRLNAQLTKRSPTIDEHRILFLYLYDVWTKLYGTSFADKMVDVEKKRKGFYDYESAWNWALALSEGERAERFKEIMRTNSLNKQ